MHGGAIDDKLLRVANHATNAIRTSSYHRSSAFAIDDKRRVIIGAAIFANKDSAFIIERAVSRQRAAALNLKLLKILIDGRFACRGYRIGALEDYSSGSVKLDGVARILYHRIRERQRVSRGVERHRAALDSVGVDNPARSDGGITDKHIIAIGPSSHASEQGEY